MEVKLTNAAPLELSLVAEMPQVPPGEAIFVKMTISNAGSRPLTINGRMLLNHPAAPDTAREIDLQISGPPGYINLKKFYVNAGPPTPDHFVELQPAEYIERRYELTKYYSLHMAGAYQLTARYTNTSPVRHAGRPAWTGTLTSTAVTIMRGDK